MDRLFHQGYDAGAVVERLHTDTDLSEPLRRTAWHAVQRRAGSNKE